jgi:hypothetical protein
MSGFMVGAVELAIEQFDPIGVAAAAGIAGLA